MPSPQQTHPCNTSAALREALRTRVVVADGAMGTMLQASDLTLDDFQGLEGCNEILNVTRPDVVRAVHDAYFEVGVDAVETNTFGANLANLGEYDIARPDSGARRGGCAIAREAADSWSTSDRPRWVIGSVGPGTKLPTLGHTTFATLAGRLRAAGRRHGRRRGACRAGRDRAGPAAGQGRIIGAKRAIATAGADLPVWVQVTVETTGTMLLGSEIGAALTALEPLGVEMIGLNCATGPAEMSEHLRYLARHSTAAAVVHAQRRAA